MWKKIDSITLATMPHLTDTDQCWFARDYISGTGFRGGETNDLVSNFKKNPGSAGQSYRHAAVRKFAEECSILFNCDRHHVVMTAIPSSKSKTDTGYTKRFEDMFAQLGILRPCITVEEPISVKKTVISSRHGGTREPQQLIENYQWNGFKRETPGILWVFDDVLVTGSHFRAYSDFLRAQGYTGIICGIFWAKRQ